jgi:hypothetical protein
VAKLHGKSTDILLGGYDVSAYFNDVSVESSIEEAETTNFASTAKEFLVGHREGSISMSGFFDGAAGGSDELINAGLGLAAGVPCSIMWQGAGTLDNTAIVANLKETSYTPGSAVGSAVSVEVEGRADAGPVYGYVLAPNDAARGVGTTSFTGHDYGAGDPNAAGWAGNLHVTSIVSGSPVLAGKFQKSADFSAYVDLASGAFASIGAVGSEHLSSNTAITDNSIRAVRWNYTITGTGSMFYVVSFGKKR